MKGCTFSIAEKHQTLSLSYMRMKERQKKKTDAKSYV